MSEPDAGELVPALRVSPVVARLLEGGMKQLGTMYAEQLPDGRYEVTLQLAPKGWTWRPPGETEEVGSDG